MNEFKDKKIIVTGGTRGIGAGIVKEFLAEQAIVTATYSRNDEAAQKFKASLGADAQRLTLKKFDVSKASEVELFWKDYQEYAGDLDVLINNSGVRKDNILASLDEQSWDSVIDVNLKGTYLMSKQAILLMMTKRYGKIVNISSIGGKLGLPGQANYAASKAGQLALSLSVSKEIAKRNITINSVCPGFIETELISDFSPEQRKEYEKQVPMKRFGSVKDVAHAVMFLASSRADYITGTSIDVAGGLNA